MEPDKPNPQIAFLALGQAHQLLHILGPAKELTRRGIKVQLFVSTYWHEIMVTRLAPELLPNMHKLGNWSSEKPKAPIDRAPARILSLLMNINRLIKFDMIVVPERTSTWLKRSGLYKGQLAHIPHGAGDRERSFESRLRFFDLVFSNGEKNRQVFIERGLVKPENCITIGYAKFDVIEDLVPQFFETPHPIVLYNPHFDKNLSSWPKMGQALIEAFKAEPKFNFIIAPHIKMRGKMRRSIEHAAQLNQATNIRFDVGSIHSINMDYTRAASIYMGDVSSQVYEFLRQPRPCVFLNPENRDWQNNPYYRHWQYGPVATTTREAMDFVQRSNALHGIYSDLQKQSFDAAIAPTTSSASTAIADELVKRLS